MTAKPEPSTNEELRELASQFPAIHQPSDCIAAVRRIGGIFASVFLSRDFIEQDGFFTISSERSKDADVAVPGAALPRRDRHADAGTTGTVGHACRIAKELRALPPVEDSRRRLTRQGLVRHLAGEIAALQQRGYSINEVVEHLAALGFQIKAPTLKSYLSKAKLARSGRKTKRTRNGSQDGAATRPQPAPADGPSAASPRQLPADAGVDGPQPAGRALASWSDLFGLPSDPDLSIDIDVDDVAER